MSVYLPKRCRVYYYDFYHAGQRYVGSTRRRHESEAVAVEAELKRRIRHDITPRDDKNARELFRTCVDIFNRRHKRDRVGYVYFIGYAAEGPVKVGFANKVERRIQQFQTAHPYRLILLGQMRATHAVERSIHEVFRPLHIQGEWFNREAPLLAFLSLVENETVLMANNTIASVALGNPTVTPCDAVGKPQTKREISDVLKIDTTAAVEPQVVDTTPMTA